MTPDDTPRDETTHDKTTHDELFTRHRGLLFGIAYEITGSVADSEDILQDSYLRWAEVELDEVANPRAYLSRVVTRQALNSLRTAQRRREDYVGPWLPEPVRTAPDAAEDVLLAESVSMAMMLVLETLGPLERAVFVLREVFGFDHAQIAAAVGRQEATVRQIAHRARSHVQARRRRYAASDEQARRVVTELLSAAAGGDVEALMAVLAPDVVHVADGGGKVTAARVPVSGARKVARVLSGLSRRPLPDMRVEFAAFNGLPALAVYSGERLDLVMLIEMDAGLVTGLYVVRNPDKLGAADRVMPLVR